MVLPWVSDCQTPAFRQGLLGCSYFESEKNEFIFAVDERFRLNLKQSQFLSLRVRSAFLSTVIFDYFRNL